MKGCAVPFAAILLAPLSYAAQAVAVEDIVGHGPRTGENITIVKTQVPPGRTAVAQREATLALSVPGAEKPNIMVNLVAYRHEFLEAIS